MYGGWLKFFNSFLFTHNRETVAKHMIPPFVERIPAALRLGDQAKSPVSQSRVPVSLRLGTSLPGVVMEPVEKEKPVKRKPGHPQEGEWSQQAQLQ
ncbi:hypothetical protein F2Q69_00009917 [Brassica cretica]|uniref:Uncharacterized protein n=1 Tax=Brassica cretica TaxID=69181 RepID=A0A8S9P3S2_BRACR|nr:hypothetical protein F2Q69_00009917 [Brassica cretica]